MEAQAKKNVGNFTRGISGERDGRTELKKMLEAEVSKPRK